MTHLFLVEYHRVIKVIVYGSNDSATFVRVLIELLVPLRLQFALTAMHANATPQVPPPTPSVSRGRRRRREAGPWRCGGRGRAKQRTQHAERMQQRWRQWPRTAAAYV